MDRVIKRRCEDCVYWEIVKRTFSLLLEEVISGNSEHIKSDVMYVLEAMRDGKYPFEYFRTKHDHQDLGLPEGYIPPWQVISLAIKNGLALSEDSLVSTDLDRRNALRYQAKCLIRVLSDYKNGLPLLCEHSRPQTEDLFSRKEGEMCTQVSCLVHGSSAFKRGWKAKERLTIILPRIVEGLRATLNHSCTKIEVKGISS